MTQVTVNSWLRNVDGEIINVEDVLAAPGTDMVTIQLALRVLDLEKAIQDNEKAQFTRYALPIRG